MAVKLSKADAVELRSIIHETRAEISKCGCKVCLSKSKDAPHFDDEPGLIAGKQAIADVFAKWRARVLEALAKHPPVPVQKSMLGRISKAWDESKHPRNPKGATGGGEFSSQVDTPEFKKWFSGSAVVDDTGDPRIMYHGTHDKDFNEFKPFSHFGTATAAEDRLALTSRADFELQGEPFSSRERIYPVYLHIENPLQVIDRDEIQSVTWLNDAVKAGAISKDESEKILTDKDEAKRLLKIRAALETAGYDGLQYENEVEDPFSKSYVAFRPMQIKSAIGNRGTFDPKQKDITKSFTARLWKSIVRIAKDDDDDPEDEFNFDIESILAEAFPDAGEDAIAELADALMVTQSAGADDGIAIAADDLGLDEDTLSAAIKEPLEDALQEYAMKFAQSTWSRIDTGIKDMLVDGLSDGIPTAAMGDLVEERFAGLQDWEADRIARTEFARGQVRAALAAYANDGIELCRIMASPDCCPICEGYADRIWPIDQVMDVYPWHPHCRCAVEAVYELAEGEQVEDEPPTNVFDDPGLAADPWPTIAEERAASQNADDGDGVEKANPNHDRLGRFSNAESSAHGVAFDDLPEVTRCDIVEEIKERIPYAKEQSDLYYDKDVRGNLEGLVHPPILKVSDFPIKQIEGYDRNPSKLAVKEYRKLLHQSEAPPILMSGNKFIDGGHRLAAYIAEGRKTIPAVDIKPLLEMDWEKYLDGKIAPPMYAGNVRKANPNHDAKGLFAASSAGLSGGAGRKIVSAAVRSKGRVYIGDRQDDVHGEIRRKHALGFFPTDNCESGYLLDSGKFLTRDQAESKFGLEDSQELERAGHYVEPEEFPAYKRELESALAKAAAATVASFIGKDAEFESTHPRGQAGRFAHEESGSTAEVSGNIQPATLPWSDKETNTFKSNGLTAEYDVLPNFVGLNDLYVEPSARGKGAATAFMNAILNRCDQEGKTAQLMAFDTHGESDDKRLEEFYKRFGFKEVSRDEGAAVMERKPHADNPDIMKAETLAKRNAANLSKSCVMSMVEPGDAKAFLDYGESIPDAELYTGEEGADDSYGTDYGRETECHVTALYGLEDSDPASVKTEIPLTVKLDKAFSPDEARDAHGKWTAAGIHAEVNDALEKTAKQYDNFKDFSHDYSLRIYHGTYWHLTDDPHFKIDPKRSPVDASSISDGGDGEPGLMVTSDIANWDDTFENERKYVAQIDLTGLKPNVDYRDTSRGFGHEMYVFKPAGAKVVRVLPIKDALNISDKMHESWIPQSEEELKTIWEKAHRK